MMVKASYVDEYETDDEVQQAPKDVDDGRGSSFAGRFREGRGEWFSGDTFDEMRDSVCKERTGEEAGDIGVPGHGGNFSRERR